jgi:hypothetical protein
MDAASDIDRAVAIVPIKATVMMSQTLAKKKQQTRAGATMFYSIAWTTVA